MQDPQQREDVAFDGEVTGHEGPGHAQLAGGPEDPAQGVDRADLMVPTPSLGPSALPSQNSKRTGAPVPTRAPISGARAAAALPGGAVPAGGGGETAVAVAGGGWPRSLEVSGAGAGARPG